MRRTAAGRRRTSRLASAALPEAPVEHPPSTPAQPPSVPPVLLEELPELLLELETLPPPVPLLLDVEPPLDVELLLLEHAAGVGDPSQ
jgi:hypothetical protein